MEVYGVKYSVNTGKMKKRWWLHPNYGTRVSYFQLGGHEKYNFHLSGFQQVAYLMGVHRQVELPIQMIGGPP